MPLVLALAAAALAVGGAASAQSSSAPASSTAPSIGGTARAGSTLTASTGTWSNNPTSYAYQWRRCATDGTSCGDIVGATGKTHTATPTDVHHTLRVTVTASNADGKATATSDATDVIGSANGPQNTVKPSVSGPAQVGEQLTVSNGSWSPAAASFSYQWQRCDSDGTGCVNVAGSTGHVYGVRSVDVGNRLRALVTAHTSRGQTTATSGNSDVVASNTTTTVVTTTVAGNRAPSLRFVSLRRIGARVYARFRVCDDSLGKVTVVERDNKARDLSYRRRFTVVRGRSCGTFARHWIPAPRFRTRGRYVVTLRAIDKSGALSRLVARSLVRR